MSTITLDGPEAITLSDVAAGVPVERDARLLVAGEYPGKSLSVTEADIDALVANFSGPVPVKVEHIDSPLDPLGHVQRVWRDGKELRGRVAFPAAMAAFLSARGAAKLSVGLLKEPAWKLLEASLTLRPHVPTATLLSEPPPGLPLRKGEGSEGITGEGATGEAGGIQGLAAELVQLRAEQREAQITGLKLSGKLVPAAEPFARALLALGNDAVVTLSDGTRSGAAAAFLGFLDAQPAVVRFSETAPGHKPDAETQDGLYGAAGDFSADEKEVLRRLGVAPEAVAQTMADDARTTATQRRGQKGGM